MRMNLIIGGAHPTSQARTGAGDAALDRDRSRGSARSAAGPRRVQCAARRIWDVDPEDLALVTGVLLRREDVESLLDRIDPRERAGDREDALRVRLLVGCGVPCALAEAVEQLLEGRTRDLEATVARCPMMQIADWWSRQRDHMNGEELAALLWRLASDPRPHLEPLASRVGGHLRLRALQLLRGERAIPGPRSASGGPESFPRSGATPRSGQPAAVCPGHAGLA